MIFKAEVFRINFEYGIIKFEKNECFQFKFY